MKTLADLRKIREKAKNEMKLRGSGTRVKVVIGMGTSGIAMGAREVMKAFLDEIASRQLHDVVVTQTGEKGLSSMEPVVDVMIDGSKTITYGKMNVEKVKRVVAEHIVNGIPVNDFIISTD